MIAYVETVAGEFAVEAKFLAHAKNDFIVEGIMYMSNSWKKIAHFLHPTFS